jgi:hypothetical protein
VNVGDPGGSAMLRRTIILILLVSVSPSWAADRNIWIGAYSTSDGKSFQWLVPYQKMKSTPSWRGEFSKLPLSFSTAVELSLAYLRKRHPGVEIQLWSISLIKLISDDPADKWYFALAFTNSKNGKPVMNLSLGTRVLLDGTVVEPIARSKP